MREVDVSRIREAVKQACGEMAVYCSADILEKLKERRDAETGKRSKIAMEMLVENAELAAGENTRSVRTRAWSRCMQHSARRCILPGEV